jgi:hypothetical protein
MRYRESKSRRILAPKCLSNLPNMLAKPDGNYRMLRKGIRRILKGNDQMTAIAAKTTPAMTATLS